MQSHYFMYANVLVLAAMAVLCAGATNISGNTPTSVEVPTLSRNRLENATATSDGSKDKKSCCCEGQKVAEVPDASAVHEDPNGTSTSCQPLNRAEGSPNSLGGSSSFQNSSMKNVVPTHEPETPDGSAVQEDSHATSSCCQLLNRSEGCSSNNLGDSGSFQSSSSTKNKTETLNGSEGKMSGCCKGGRKAAGTPDGSESKMSGCCKGGKKSAETLDGSEIKKSSCCKRGKKPVETPDGSESKKRSCCKGGKKSAETPDGSESKKSSCCKGGKKSAKTPGASESKISSCCKGGKKSAETPGASENKKSSCCKGGRNLAEALDGSESKNSSSCSFQTSSSLENIVPEPVKESDGMKPYFHTSWKGTYVLFKWWKIDTSFQYVMSLFSIFILGMLFEGLQYLQKWADSFMSKKHDIETANMPSEMYSFPQEIVRAFLHMFRAFTSLMLMLIFMTYEWGLCLALVAGSGAGFFVSSRYRQ